MTPFQEKMAQLDAALTRKSWHDVSHTARTQKFTADRFIDRDIYYLSDGGYSRICYDWESGRIFLDSVSLQTTKDNWASCAGLIAEVETFIVEALGDDA
jgi:hypothetical protein